MDDLMKKEYAEKSTKEAPEGRTWYIPHHGVYHPSKPGKIRVVFDCSTKFQEESLNKNLMSGSDLTNQIVGVLTRFREEPVVIIGDIESMFHQVMVPREDRSFLRFLWWENHDISGTAKDFEMCVHVFGGTSSPSCCNYAYERTAYDNKSRYQTDVMDTLNRNFYVDDLLKSVKDVKTAIRLLHDVISMCADGGFRLTKFVINRIEVLDSIPEEDRRTGVKDVYLNSGTNFPTEKALGVNWDIGSDRLGFKLNLDGKPTTRRQMLSMISKIYDPRGLAAPFLLKAKRMLKELCKSNFSWDDAVSDNYIVEWEKWKKELQLLENLKMERCFKPSKFGKVIDCSLHHFSNASQDGYGQVTYFRIVDDKGCVKCSLVMAKSRVPPTKFVSIPRLELTAAALSMKVSSMLRREQSIHPIIKEYIWTDNEVVLGYINNDAKRFKIYVANRVQLIRENSDVNQWMYIDARSNPADDTSRGISPSNQEKVNRWLNGPEFLWLDESKLTIHGKQDIPEIDQDDPEVKTKLSVHVASAVNEGITSTMQGRISSWSKLLKVTAWVMRWIKIVRKRVNKTNIDEGSPTQLHVLSVEKLIAAEGVVIKGYQRME